MYNAFWRHALFVRGQSFSVKTFDRSRNGCQVIGEGAGNDFLGSSVQALPLPSRVSFSRARFFLSPLLPSACYAGYFHKEKFLGFRNPESLHEAKQTQSNPVTTDTKGAIESVRFRGVSVLSEKRVMLFKSKRHPLLEQNTKEIIEEILVSSNYTSLTDGFVKKPSFRRLTPRKQ